MFYSSGDESRKGQLFRDDSIVEDSPEHRDQLIHRLDADHVRVRVDPPEEKTRLPLRDDPVFDHGSA